MPIADYFANHYERIFKTELDILDRTRVRILAVCLLNFIGLCSTALILFLFQENNFLPIRMGMFLVLFIIGLALLLFRQPWSLAGHFLIICITLMIWSGILLFRQSVNAATAEAVILVVSGGYYLLGRKWGTFYSLINMAPIVGYVILDDYVKLSLPTQQLNLNHHGYMLGLVSNFLLLLYIHYTFFQGFQKSQRQEHELREHLQKALVAEQEQAAAKINFLSTMSHELRTPLNAVIGMTHILQTEAPRADQSEHLQVLQFSASNLMATVNDILDFNKIEHGSVTLDQHPFHLAELLNNVCGSFRAKAVEKGIDFSCKIGTEASDLTVLGDSGRLTSILFNLIGNAVKFTSAGHVRVEVMVFDKAETTVSLRIRVEDTGIGIPQDRQALIFQPFAQVISRTNRQYHGTGLGLTIAHRLLELHGSRLDLHSTEGVGTTFSFQLTYPLSTQPPPVEIAKGTDPVLSLRVLVAEDEPINTLVIKKILSKWGIVPQIAVNGKEAVDMVINEYFDVVLMDINMPVMDGLEAARRIKAMPDPKKAAIPVIAVTASIGKAIAQISSYPYIDDCLLKPFKPGDLLEKLQKLEQANSKTANE